MTRFNEYDVVSLTTDLPEYGLSKGQKGTIVLCYTKPDTAFEVEFSNHQGQTLALLTLAPDQMHLFWSSPSEAKEPQKS